MKGSPAPTCAAARRRVGLLAAALLVLPACASAPAPPPPAEPVVELDAVEALLWRGEVDAALARLEELAWVRTGSVAAERLRQDLLLERGGRARLRRELAAADPGERVADLRYLRARLIEDPLVRHRALVRGHLDHPNHPWLGLGAAAGALALGEAEAARRLLAETPRSEASDPFRRLVAARLHAREHRPRLAFAALAEDALEAGRRDALSTLLALARDAGDARWEERARAEIGLRRAAGDDDLGGRLDRVLLRLEAEAPWLRDASLDQVLDRLDRWCAVADVPGGLAATPRYRVGGFAELLRPELAASAWARAWAEAGRFLLLGWDVRRGPSWLYLRDAVVHPLALGDDRPPVELVLAAEGWSHGQADVMGGAPFHGLFLRLDRVRLSASRAAARLARVEPELLLEREAPPPDAEAGPLAADELALRLRLALRAEGADFDALELETLLLHEVAHLPESLEWSRSGVPVVALLPAVARSWLLFRDPVLFLEERAMLRALASGRRVRWQLADLCDRAFHPGDAYFRPARRLLADLAALGAERGLPPLRDWDRVAPKRIAAVAAALLRRRGLEPLDLRLQDEAMAALRGEDLLPPLDRDRDSAAVLDHGEVDRAGPAPASGEQVEQGAPQS